MPVHARRCEGCGGPLPEAPANALTITCHFCGVVHDVSQTIPIRAPAAATAGGGRIARPPVKGSIVPVLVIFGIFLLLAIAVVAGVRRIYPTLVAIDTMNRNAGRTPV